MRVPSSARSAASAASRGRACSATCDRNIGRFSIALVGLVLSSLIGLAFPLVIAGITTEVVAGGDAAGLDRLVLILLGLFCIQAVGSFLQTYLLGVVGERVVAQLRGDLFGRLVTLSLDFHAGRRVGELVSRLSSDVTLVRTMLTQTVTSLLSSVIGLVGSVIILFTLSPTLLFIVLLLAPALIAVAIVFGRPLSGSAPRSRTRSRGARRRPRRRCRGSASSRAMSARTGSSSATTRTSGRSSRPARGWRCGGRRSGR